MTVDLINEEKYMKQKRNGSLELPLNHDGKDYQRSKLQGKIKTIHFKMSVYLSFKDSK